MHLISYNRTTVNNAYGFILQENRALYEDICSTALDFHMCVHARHNKIFLLHACMVYVSCVAFPCRVIPHVVIKRVVHDRMHKWLL